MKNIFLFFFLVVSRLASGQSASPVLLATCTGGGNFDDTRIFWSVGEVSITTLGSTPYQITQGFWQPEWATLIGVNNPQNAEFGIACTPNPVADILQITYTSDTPLNLALYSLDGRLLLQQNAIKNGALLSLAQLPASLYLLRFTSGDGRGIQTQKIVKQ